TVVPRGVENLTGLVHPEVVDARAGNPEERHLDWIGHVANVDNVEVAAGGGSHDAGTLLTDEQVALGTADRIVEPPRVVNLGAARHAVGRSHVLGDLLG